MADNVTRETGASVTEFLEAVEHPRRRADGLALCELFSETTGWQPTMWGPTIVGFGRYHYTYESGREGDSLATGFSPRAKSLSLYVMPGYQDFSEILARLGKHRTGKSCLYVNTLDDVDTAVLAELITAGLTRLNEMWPVKPS